MKFNVTLRNQLTGTEKTVTVKSSYDAVAVLASEAKRQMNIYSAWDYVDSERIS